MKKNPSFNHQMFFNNYFSFLASALPLQPTSTNHQNNSLNNQLITRKTPETFLGANSNLVNLDALVSGKSATTTNQPTTVSTLGNNPFASVSVPSNPFQKAPPPTINQLRSQNNFTLDNGNFISSSNGSHQSTSLPSSQQNPLNSLILNQPINPTQISTPNNPFAM